MGLRGPCLLLLPLIGAVLSQAQAARSPAAASTAPPSWRLVDQRSLGLCLHRYLERDFERLINPAGRSSTAARGAAAARNASRMLADDPNMEACQHMTHLVGCFSWSLDRMQYYDNFSEFRRLLVALNAVLLELCGAVDLMRHRLVPLLQSLKCIEQVRAERSHCPYRDRLPPNIWQQLIRLEADSTLCWPLTRQLDCVRDEGLIHRFCGEPAQHLFSNISSVFLRHWCLNAGSSLSQIPFISKVLIALVSLLSFSSFLPSI